MTKLEKVAKSGLHQSVRACLDGFRQVVAQLDADQPEATKFGPVWDVWEAYYSGEFARFDMLLESYVRHRGDEYESFIPISISHHNLHRLMEVFRLEIGEGPLSATRVTERIGDLFEVCNRLVKLLEETSAPDAAETV